MKVLLLIVLLAAANAHKHGGLFYSGKNQLFLNEDQNYLNMIDGLNNDEISAEGLNNFEDSKIGDMEDLLGRSRWCRKRDGVCRTHKTLPSCPKGYIESPKGKPYCMGKRRRCCFPGKEGGVIISGQYLTFSTDELTWAAAVNKCKSLGGRLATLNNPQAVHSYMYKKFRDPGFWVGGTDQAHEGTWVWTNGQTFSSFPWGQDEPNGNTGENCLNWGTTGYNDYKCHNTLRYVCEHGYN